MITPRLRRLAWLMAAPVVLAIAASPATKPSTAPTTQPQTLRIDMDRALNLPLPEIREDLKPVSFKTKDGKDAWVLRVPGSRPIATPAYADGLIFVGGGYGSHEFYALKADSGEVAWKINTTDDGPSAAVVDDGYCAFNTESCTVIVVDARTGKLMWQEWLGDPLMSQPAIADGKLYIAYPGGQARGVQSGATTAPASANHVGPAKGAGHRLLCADLKTGKHLWEQDITADVITAPVIDQDQVLLTCFDGTSFCLKSNNGEIVWKKEHAGTSAPLVAGDQVVVTQKEQPQGQPGPQEGMKRLEIKGGKDIDHQLLAAGSANYLKQGAGGNGGLASKSQQALDASVGFANAPQSAALDKAAGNVNVTSVAGGWAYQGSRAAYSGGQLLNTQANSFNCISSDSGRMRWRATATGKDVTNDAQLFAPPAAGKKNLYVCSTRGELISLRQSDGNVEFMYATQQPMSFQPALARGNLYAGTNNGMIICLKTGNGDADNWSAWGGNARHNKKD